MFYTLLFGFIIYQVTTAARRSISTKVADEGEPFTLECDISADYGNVEYVSWYKYGVFLHKIYFNDDGPTSGKERNWYRIFLRLKEGKFVLQWQALTEADEGEYKCRIRFKSGGKRDDIVRLKVRKITCPVFPVTDNTEISYSNDNKVGSVATFSCPNSGYLVGNSTTICLQNRTWSNPLAACGKITCPVFPVTDNLEISYSNDNKEGSVATFTCQKSGYMIGNSTAICLRNGNWTNSLPLCRNACWLPKERGSCSDFTVKWYFDIAYGGCSRFWYGGCGGNGNNFATQDECEGICVTPKETEACLLPVVTGPCKGEFPLWYFDAGSKTCETFTYSGCLGNNNRFSTKTSCEAACINQQPAKITCSAFPITNNIEISYSNDNTEGSVATFSCQDSGNLIGNSSSVCLENGTWSNSLPLCRKTGDICNLPNQTGPCLGHYRRWYFNSANQICKSFVYGGCGGNENRFKTHKDCEHHCLKTDKTKGITCLLFPVTDNLDISYSNDNKQGSVATFICHKSRNMVENSTSVCLGNGTWSNSLPLCRKITCPVLPVADNIEISYSNDNSEGSVATFTCHKSAYLVGNSTAVCLGNGTWSNSLPLCTSEPVCRIDDNTSLYLIISPEKEVYGLGEVISLSCPPFYVLTETIEIMMCLADGWTDAFPGCKDLHREKKCPMFEAKDYIEMSYSNGNKVGSVATFRCQNLENVIVISAAVCLVNGTWSASLPSCGKITCPVFPEIHNIEITYSNDNKEGSLATFTCQKSGYLAGNSTAVCLANGTWSNSLPLCRSEPVCRIDDSTSPHLIVSPEKEFYRLGEVILLSCPPFYILTETVEIMMCLSNGWTDAFPGCKDLRSAKKCPMFPATDDIEISYSNGNKVGSVATFRCQNLQNLIVSSAAVCLLNGTWSVSLPSCGKITCPVFPETDNIEITYSNDNKEGSVATFSCPPNSESMVGNATAVCLRNRTWSNSLPSCKKLTCPVFPVSDNIEISYSNGNKEGSVAIFRCQIAGNMVGNSTAVCLENGTWSNLFPLCRTVTCPAFRSSKDLEISYSNGNKVGSTAVFRCHHPDDIIGNSTAVCLENGKWTNALPLCKSEFLCRIDENTSPHLVISPRKEFYSLGESIYLWCSPYYVLTERVEKMMCMGGKWTDAFPGCTQRRPNYK